MSRPIGALFHVPHGISNAMLDEACFAYILDGAYDRFGQLARELGRANPDDSDQAASEKFLEIVKELCGYARFRLWNSMELKKIVLWNNWKKWHQCNGKRKPVQYQKASRQEDLSEFISLFECGMK